MRIRKNICITDEQSDFIREYWVNLSQFVQNKLDEYIIMKKKDRESTKSLVDEVQY